MRQFEDDFEIEAIEKCSRALNRLDDKTKIRVIKYLLDKFGLIAQTEPQAKEVVNQNIQYQQNNLVLAEPKDFGNVSNGTKSFLGSGNFISLKDVLIKNLTKTEAELLIVIGFYNSNYGKTTFTRQSILDSLRENNINAAQRRKNLTQNINSLIKKSFFNTITDDELSISSEGCEYAQNILAGNSTTKKRKPRLKNSKIQKQNDSIDTNIETDDINE